MDQNSLPSLAKAYTASVNEYFEEYLRRLGLALDVLGEDGARHRSHDGLPTVHHLLRHLEGNVRQWILSGLGGARDDRERAQEFDSLTRQPATELLHQLDETVRSACTVIAGLTEEDLLAERTIQGFQVRVMHAVNHILEHFSWHTGQIIVHAKQWGGREHGIALYDEDAINQARNESPETD